VSLGEAEDHPAGERRRFEECSEDLGGRLALGEGDPRCQRGSG
jgi:hypothetical protein